MFFPSIYRGHSRLTTISSYIGPRFGTESLAAEDIREVLECAECAVMFDVVSCLCSSHSSCIFPRVHWHRKFSRISDLG